MPLPMPLPMPGLVRFLSEALLATWRRTLSGRTPASKLLLLPSAPSPFGTRRDSIRVVGDVVERRWSMGELDVEPLPAVEGRRGRASTPRVMEGEEGSPINIPERRFDMGIEAPPTGDPRRPALDDDGGGDIAAPCSSCRCWASGATSWESSEPRFTAPAEEGPEEWPSTESPARRELDRDNPPPYGVSGEDASVELACEFGLASLLPDGC